MVLEGAVNAVNLTDIVSVLPVDVSDSVLRFILVLKAIGIAAIFYVLYVIFMGVFTYRKIKKLGSIERKIDDLERKMDSVNRKLNRIKKS